VSENKQRVAGRRALRWGRVLLVLGVPAALLALAVFAIPVTRCELRGASRYSAAEFSEAMRLEEHALRLYNLDKAALALEIHRALPYAHVTAVNRRFPTTVRLKVEELSPMFVQEQDGLLWLISEGGKLLECTQQPQDGLLPLTGARLKSPKEGRGAHWVNAFTAPGDLALLRDALTESPLWPEITGLRISTAALPDAIYQDRVRIRFDSAFSREGDLGNKIQLAGQILAELEAENPECRGILDLSIPGSSYFTPEWGDGGEETNGFQ
jgi:hypothetical protein